jgi:hypothetical protein
LLSQRIAALRAATRLLGLVQVTTASYMSQEGAMRLLGFWVYNHTKINNFL